MHVLFCIGWMSNLLVNAFRNFYYWDSRQSLLIIINIYHLLLLIWYTMADYNLLLHVVVYAVLLALGWYVVNLSSVVQLLSFYEPISITGNWELYTIIINLKLSLSPYTDTQMLKKWWKWLFDVPSKIVLQCSLSLLEPTNKQKFEPIPLYPKEIGTGFTFINRVSPDHHL